MKVPNMASQKKSFFLRVGLVKYFFVKDEEEYKYFKCSSMIFFPSSNIVSSHFPYKRGITIIE